MAADNKVIESTKIAAGKRTYFLDVKLTRENLRYLKITESKKVDNGQFERNRIIIFEEDIHQIMDSLTNCL